MEEFSNAVSTLRDLSAGHSKVLVHCHSGCGRSVAVVAALLAEIDETSGEEALKRVAALRSGLNFVPIQLKALSLDFHGEL